MYKKYFILKIYTRIVLLGFFCILVCVSCVSSSKVNDDNYCCSINYHDRIENFNNFNKSIRSLKIPENLDFSLPEVCDDYVFPIMHEKSLHETKKSINICPPVVLDDIHNELCLQDMQ